MSNETKTKIQWSVLGDEQVHSEPLSAVTSRGARVGPPEVPSRSRSSRLKVGCELRFELKATTPATGLARVTAIATDGSLEVTFLALGIDATVLGALANPSSARTAPAGPPPLPKGPPPLPTPGAKVQAAPPASVPPPAEEILAEIEQLDVRAPGLIIGIDLGTTYTCASYVEDGRPRIIPSRTGASTIPSMITFDPDGSWYVGQRAVDRLVMYPMRTVYGSKRLLGRTYTPELAAQLQEHFAYPLAEAHGLRFGVRIDDRVVGIDTIAARVLDEVRTTAEAHLGRPVEAAVISVPAYFSEVQRDAVRRAASEAQLVVHRIVNEPTAAAVAYGHKQVGLHARVAVWDFGGGTFDFSVVDVSDGDVEVLACGGDNFVGGSDFDDLLATYLLAEFNRRERTQIEPDALQIARLREAAEITKRELSSETERVVELPEFTRAPRRNLKVEVTRAAFEKLARPLIDRTIAIALEVLKSRGLSARDVDDVVLVGGSTRVPAVQKAVADLFGRRPSKRINPDEAVALGAALLADEIGKGPTLVDILPMTIGHGVSGLRFVPIVARHARLPADRTIELTADVLGSVTLPLFQGESPDVAENEFLCSVLVEDRSLWDKGRVALTISFDEHCVMAVEARNAKTGRPLAVRLDRSRSLDEVLRDLGRYAGPPAAPRWTSPPTLLGGAVGRLSVKAPTGAKLA